MFSGASALVSVGDLSGWNTAKVKNLTAMFNNARSLTALDLSGWDTSKVTKFARMFNDTHELVSVGDLSGWNTGKATDMSAMFNNARSLPALDLSGWNTSKVTDMTSLFSGTDSLKSLDLSGWDTRAVNVVDGMFESSGLRIITIGDTTVLPTGAGLPSLSSDNSYGTLWRLVGSGDVDNPQGDTVGDSSALLARFGATGVAGTYTRVKIAVVTPIAPSQNGSQVTIPTMSGVDYTDGAGNALSGTVTLADGVSLHIVATPTDMNTSFASGAPVSWDFSYSVSSNGGGASNNGGASNSGAGESSNRSAAGAETKTARQGDSLATTGVNLDIMVSLGLAMIVLGALIVTRRRRIQD